MQQENSITFVEVPPVEGTHCPWGIIQHAGTVSGGSRIVSVSTEGHGGWWIPEAYLELLSDEAKAFASKWSHGWGPQWFEEDCAVAYLVWELTGFSLELKVHAREQLLAMGKCPVGLLTDDELTKLQAED